MAKITTVTVRRVLGMAVMATVFHPAATNNHSPFAYYSPCSDTTSDMGISAVSRNFTASDSSCGYTCDGCLTIHVRAIPRRLHYVGGAPDSRTAPLRAVQRITVGVPIPAIRENMVVTVTRIAVAEAPTDPV